MGILSILYGMIVKFRNFLYNKKILKIKKIEDVEIICIGNITVGGTGKTPAVQYFAKKYTKEGKKVVIVSRGYRGEREEEPLIVSNGIKILTTVRESGDEPFLHAMNVSVPVIVGKDRYEAAFLGKKEFNADIILLDDGFQHRKLYRDKNIILIDATNPFGNKMMLPKGRLREPISELKRADEFIITKSDLVDKKKILEIKKELTVFGKKIDLAIHKPDALYDLQRNSIGLDEIKNKKIILFSGLANPENFEKTLETYNPKKIFRMDFEDHYNFTKDDVSAVEKRLKKIKYDIIITTEKDLVKLPETLKNKNIYVLRIEFKIMEEKDDR
ncbi:MAG: tetraacyldisaccharide 4'-kinase [Fusobacteriia bacterium 4572_132]|nr:MAG: tetraacyldisaccharide 4'-kinase [Fusobacteriia bacterium 4572_132]